MKLQWEEGFQINLAIQDTTVTISANREGLLSLANHLIALAKEDVGSHIHLDEHNALEDGSVDLILEKSE
jgi:hypothetical protein